MRRAVSRARWPMARARGRSPTSCNARRLKAADFFAAVAEAGFSVEDVRIEHVLGRPTGVVEITVGEVYTQCPKALVRSHLWDPAGHRTHDDIPTVGQIMAQIVEGFDGQSYDEGYPAHMARTIY